MKHTKQTKVLLRIIIIISSLFSLIRTENIPLLASTVVKTQDFRLTADNAWENVKKKPYAKLNWEAQPQLSNNGYTIYQSKDNGKTWDTKSGKYGKPIKVLNIYPNYGSSNTLKKWMDGLNLTNDAGQKLINVTPVSMNDFNANPNGYLKSGENYQYDVLMFGTWDSNYYNTDLNAASYQATKAFADTGRGILFGHDTIRPNEIYFWNFANSLGIKASNKGVVGSSNIQIVNNGYLMQYPFPIPKDAKLVIPYAHSSQYVDKTQNPTVWAHFIPPFSNPSWSTVVDNSVETNLQFLVTKNNLGMIQTGHSNGTSTKDEQMIIANTLYNLAQVSFDDYADDQSVEDTVAPKLPEGKIVADGTVSNFNATISTVDLGNKYQWYIEADTKNLGKRNSDIVEEIILSDLAGYIYIFDNKSDTIPAITKDKNGYVTNINQPVTLPNKTIIVGPFNGLTDCEKYIHVRAVDRVGNVSGTKHIKIKEIMDKFQVNEKYTADDGTTVTTSTSQVVEKGKEYSKTAPLTNKYEAYAYSIDGGVKKSGTIAKIQDMKDHHTVEFFYRKKKTTITVIFEDEEGKPLVLTDGTTVANKVLQPKEVDSSYDLTNDKSQLPELYQERVDYFEQHGYLLRTPLPDYKMGKVPLTSDGKQTYKFIFVGGLMVNQPANIKFEDGKVTPVSQELRREDASNDWSIKVFDRRETTTVTGQPKRGEWKLTVEVDEYLKNGNHQLDKELYYEQADGQEYPVGKGSVGAVPVIHHTNNSESVATVKMPAGKGLKLKIGPSADLKKGKYVGKVKWVVLDTP